MGGGIPLLHIMLQRYFV